MKSQSTVGAGDSMVGAMTLRLAEQASLEDMVRFGVAAGSAATINHGTRLCSLTNTQKIYDYLCGRDPFTRVKGSATMVYARNSMHNNRVKNEQRYYRARDHR